jgi:hypothetical protein
MLLSSKGELSHLSDGTNVVYRGRRNTAPVGLGTVGNVTASGSVGGTVSRGATNLVGPIAGLCGLITVEGIGPDQLQLTDREKDHERRRNRPTNTHRS